MPAPTMTPAICDFAADRAIGAYIREVGAYGDPLLVLKAMEMLVSKAALGIGQVSSQGVMADILLRCARNAVARLEEQPGRTLQ